MARPPSDIRERIVVAARTRFLQQGVDGASLRQIAKDAATNIGMVYYYYKTKDELFLAVVQDVYGDLLADIEAVLGGDAPEQQRFEALYERLARLSDEEFAVLRLVLREALISSARLTDIGQLFFRGHVPVVMSCISQGIGGGRLRTDVSPLLLLASSMLLGFLPQLAHRLASATDTPLATQLPSRSVVAQGMAEILFHGIAKTPKSVSEN